MRSSFGSISPRKNRNGEYTSLLARYQNPKKPGQRVTKGFPLGQKAQAQHWLDEEEKLVDAYLAGTADWIEPAVREKMKERSDVSFREYANEYLETYRKDDGSEVTVATMRKMRKSVDHLIGFFGDMPMADMTEERVSDFLDNNTIDGATAKKRAYQELKVLCKRAIKEKLLAEYPCTRPNPRTPKSKQAEIPPVIPDELQTIYEVMPDYCRISVRLASVFGLRISECCALQRGDFDLKHKMLHIRHALTRGEGDVGEYRLAPTKTPTSAATMFIPDKLIPELENHFAQYCDEGPEAMVLKPKKTKIMAPGSLRHYFDKARRAAGRPDLHFHTLRASAITAAVEEGATPKEAQVFGRHADAKISLEFYQRASKQKEKALANKVYDAMVKPERTRDVIQSEIDQAEKEVRALRRRIAQLRHELGSVDQ